MSPWTLYSELSALVRLSRSLATHNDLNRTKDEIMAKISELKGIVTALTAQVTKSKQEIVDKISALEAALNNMDPEVPEDVTAALDELKVAVQAVDDLNPDAVVPPPIAS